MARSCGLRIGPRRFELVVLDGGPRKHKISAYTSGEFPAAGDVPACAEILKEAVRSTNVPAESVGVAVDTRLASFRTLSLPFADKSKIEQVIKYEIESELPQWNVDDVVVDHFVTRTRGDSSELLVTAVAKSGLQRVLAICQAAGIEPAEMELETSAMVNAACTAEICGPENAQILVHVGEDSTSVVVMDGGRVHEMRAIHIGASTYPAPAMAAAGAAGSWSTEPASGLDVLQDPLEKASGEDAEDSSPDPIEVLRRQEQAIKRIRRELGRTVSAARTEHPLEAIYVCGRELPGLVGSSVMDVPVYILDAFDEDGGQPADGFGELVVAYGSAVGRLGGGPLKPSLRREELRYTGAFERMEMPLAVFCLLLVTGLGLWNVFTYQERQAVEASTDLWVRSGVNFLMGNLKEGRSGNLAYPSDAVRAYTKKISEVEFGDPGYPGDPDRTRYEQLAHVRALLRSEKKKMEEDLGRGTEVAQPMSALHAAQLVLDELLERGIAQGARPSLRSVTATYQPSRNLDGKGDTVLVDLDVTFFAENSVAATGQFEDFKNRLESAPWASNPKSRETLPLEQGNGIYVNGLEVQVDLSVLSPKIEVAQQ